MTVRIEKIAKELLMEEDCVVIPGFGGFVTHYRPAIFEPSKSVIIPPGKSISFNAKLNKNDGLLAQTIAMKCSISYNDALKTIQSKIKTWELELKKSNFLELEDLGSFVQNKEGNLIFNQFNESNFASTSFGLANVYASPIDRLGLSNRIEKGLSNQKAKPKFLKVVKVSAVAASILAAVALIGVKRDYVGDQLLSLNPFALFTADSTAQAQPEIIAGESVEVNAKPVTAETIDQFFDADEKQLFQDQGLLDEPENLEKIEQMQQKAATAAAITSDATPAENKVTTPNKVAASNTASSGKFHVIAGCFGVKANANKMVKQLQNQGYPAQIVGKSKSGLHRVTYGSYHTRVDALKALAKAKLEHNNNAWLAKD